MFEQDSLLPRTRQTVIPNGPPFRLGIGDLALILNVTLTAGCLVPFEILFQMLAEREGGWENPAQVNKTS